MNVTKLQAEVRRREAHVTLPAPTHPATYHGYTHPGFLSRHLPTLWNALGCRRGWHLWDEVVSDDEHYLHCDVCGAVFYGEFYGEGL
jgi:hypothetical protein